MDASLAVAVSLSVLLAYGCLIHHRSTSWPDDTCRKQGHDWSSVGVMVGSLSATLTADPEVTSIPVVRRMREYRTCLRPKCQKLERLRWLPDEGGES